MQLYLDELPQHKKSQVKDITGFLLRGMESAYVNSIISLQTEFGYKVIAPEFDGVVTIGEIPQEARNMAAILSGFTFARMIEKPFNSNSVGAEMKEAA